jgi:hypothetical protein
LVLDNWVATDGGLTQISSFLPTGLSYKRNGGATQITASLALIDNFNFISGVSVTPGDGALDFGNIPAISGDTITILSGTYTKTAGVVANFNPLTNQTFTGNVFLAESNNATRVSNIVVIPEASSALLGLSGLATLALRRRRN